MKNHYNALELDKNCTEEEIKNSYIKLTKKYHPDKNRSEEAKTKILEINEAYSVLKNKSSRYQYDERLQWYSAEQKFNQARASSYYTRPQTYNDYVDYYQKMRANGLKDFNKPSFRSKQFSVVLCCCMLMMFGAGLRIMYAWSEAHHRRLMNQMAARNLSESKEEKSERLKHFQSVWEKLLECNQKKSK